MSACTAVIAMETSQSLNYAAVCRTAGLVLFNLERGCWPDAFSAYEQMHESLSLPMVWGSFRSMSIAPLTLTHHIGRILRAITEPDILSAVASADREFRRARVRFADSLENEARHLASKLENVANYSVDSTGAATRAADVVRLTTLRLDAQEHRNALRGRR